MMGNKNYVSVYPWIDDRKFEDFLVARIEDTPVNISAFIVNADYDACYAFVEDNGNVKVYSNGQFLDYVPDINYLENELKPVLLKMQFGDMDIPNIIYENDNKVKANCLKEDESYYKDTKINPKWTIYDQTVASTHLNNYGVIFCDKEYGTPIDDEYELEEIVNVEIPDYFEEDEEQDEGWCIE